MFGLSTWEVLIILAVALIFVGPDQLPKVARQIGKGVRQVRSAVGKVDDEMRRAVREAAAQFDDDGNPLDDDDAPKPARDPHAVVPQPMPVDPSLANAVPPQPAETIAAPPPVIAPVTPVSHVVAATTPASGPADAPIETTVTPGPMTRDWSQVGKAPVPGRVATLVTPAPAPQAQAAAAQAEPITPQSSAPPETAPRPEKPAA